MRITNCENGRYRQDSRTPADAEDTVDLEKFAAVSTPPAPICIIRLLQRGSRESRISSLDRWIIPDTRLGLTMASITPRHHTSVKLANARRPRDVRRGSSNATDSAGRYCVGGASFFITDIICISSKKSKSLPSSWYSRFRNSIAYLRRRSRDPIRGGPAPHSGKSTLRRFSDIVPPASLLTLRCVIRFYPGLDDATYSDQGPMFVADARKQIISPYIGRIAGVDPRWPKNTS